MGVAVVERGQFALQEVVTRSLTDGYGLINTHTPYPQHIKEIIMIVILFEEINFLC